MDYYKIVDLLQKKIKEEQDANTAYRLGDAIMSDDEYDFLVEEINDLQNKLESLNPNHELLAYDPQKIGIQISDNDERKENLPIVMASMNKVRDLDEVKEWFRLKNLPLDIPIVLTPKYDGISLCVDEEHNYAWTRGDGEKGQRSDEHFKKMNQIYPKSVHIYSIGEVVVQKDIFEKKYSINALGEEKGYSNARNIVAGKMNDKYPNEILRDFTFIRYGYFHKYEHKLLNKQEQIKGLNKMNSIPVPYRVKTIDELDDNYLLLLFEEWKQDFEIDGIVLDIDDAYLREELDRDTKNNPHFAKAYKNPSFAECKETFVKNINYNVSKQGFIKPTIEVETVKLDGAQVSHVTANNARFVKKMGIDVNERVLIKRSGMVIPNIVAVGRVSVPDPNDKEAIDNASEQRSHVCQNLPSNCPSCDSNLEWNETQVELVCKNPDCKAQQLERIISFFDIMKVEEMGEGNVKLFYEEGFDTVEKILKMKKKDMEKLPGFGKRKAEVVFNSIHKKMKNVPLSRVQHASGYFKNLGTKKLELLEHLDNPSLEDVKQIEGFAEKSAQFYLDGLSKFNNFIARLPIAIKKGPSSNKFKDMNIVFTGFRNEEWEEAVKDGGGKISNNVTKKTNFVVSENPGHGSSKEKKADDYGIQVISKEEFEETFKPLEDKGEKEENKEEGEESQLKLFN